MRKLFIVAFLSFLAPAVFSQDDTTVVTIPRTTAITTRTGDHFVLQIGGLSWQNKPDSIRTSGFPRTFNVYLMLAFPFKTNPNLSVALGPGLATDHMFLDKMNVGIKENSQNLRFQNVADTNHFKKYKLATAYLEAPVELRFSSRPGDDARSVKAAIGAKVGMLLSAWVKGKTLEDRSGNEISGYTLKEKSKNYFNTTRISLAGRIGYGHFSAFASYALTPLFKEGLGPKVNPMSIGLTISGL